MIIKLMVEGLDCPSCAEKIKSEISKIKNVKKVELDFLSKKLDVTTVSDNKSDIVENVKSIVKYFEPDVLVSEVDSSHVETSYFKEEKKNIFRMIIAFIIFIIGFFTEYKFILFSIAYLVSGYDVIIKAFKNILKLKPLDESFLMTIASLGAFFINEYAEAVAVMLFYQAGELFNDFAVHKSRKSISNIMKLRPDYANIMHENKMIKTSPENVKIGEFIYVKSGERVPIDGVVLEGTSYVDNSAITGESVPIKIEKNSEIYSGGVNLEGLIKVKTTKDFKNSTLNQILELTQTAHSKKAITERFITRFANIYTPVVVALALILLAIPVVIFKQDFSTWLYKSLTFLVVSCPCALVISVPLSYFGGIGRAAKRGIIIKGGVYMETLSKCNYLVLDKTGTLTKGNFKVVDIKAKSVSEDDLIKYCAYAESISNHPIANAIKKSYKGDIPINEIKGKEITGKGLMVSYKDKVILCGNEKLLSENNISVEKSENSSTIIHVAVNGQYYGYVEVADEIKKEAFNFIKNIKKIGVQKAIMLTGDKKDISEKIASKLNLDEVKSELLPSDKLSVVDELINKSNKVIFVGDGVNDAPVLARADIGIAMGGVGTDSAIEAADIIIMNDDLNKINEAISISKKTKNIVMQNIIFALVIKFSVLILSALGIVSMWWAVFADVGVSFLAIINSMSLLYIKK
jgi:Cd2+/Zn2+-exporting ATPase